MRKPNFFIVGAPKCGTTSLSEYLRSHPQMFVSNPKEPFYFCTDLPGLRKVRSEAAYLELFRRAGTQHLAVGEASAIYLYSSDAIQQIREFNKDARIIVMLRNPVELLPSYHSQQLSALNEEEHDFARAWHLQQARAGGELIPRLCRADKVLQYRAVGLLGKQVERLVSIFPRQQILFVLFDDFAASTAAVYNTVLQFLDVPGDGRRNFPRLNQHKVHRFRVVEFLRRTIARNPMLERTIKRGVERMGVSSSLNSFVHKPTRRQPLDAAMCETLHASFAADVQLLSTLINRDLTHWSAPTRVAA